MIRDGLWGPPSFCVPVGGAVARWRLLRVVALGEFGQLCPFGKWVRGGGYDLAGHSPRLPYGVFSFPLCFLPRPLVRGLELVELVLIFSCYGHPARGFCVEEMRQILSRAHRPGRKSV